VTKEAAVTRRVPLAVKLAYTAFVAVLVPAYWAWYGPTNFLYFCDVALFLTLGALWLESPLLASVAAVSILVPQVVWVADFASGGRLVGMTAYMFDANKASFVRGLSLFHGWLPFLLVWLVWRLGYDRRALAVQTVAGWALLTVCYVWMPAPPPPADDPERPVNINYVYGPSDERPQTWVPPDVWFALLMAGIPLCFYLPAHLALARLCPAPAPSRPRAAADDVTGGPGPWPIPTSGK
jgi:hypothetical protein